MLRSILLVAISAASILPGEEPAITALTDDGAWCWFQDPRAVYIDGKHRRTYAGWMTHDGALTIGSVDHDSREIVTHVLDPNWGRDDHNNNAFLVLPDKRLAAFFAQHNNAGIYCQTTTNPEDITSWNERVTITPRGDGRGITYAHPAYLSSEQTCYVFYRGSNWKPTFSTSTDLQVWTPEQTLLTEPGREANSIRPYTKYCSNGIDTIHVTFTDGHPRNEPTNSVYYVCISGGKIRKADGTIIGSMDELPAAISTTDLVYDAKATGHRAWVHDIAYDKHGHPFILYTRLPSEDDHHYHRAWWDGERWQDVEICAGGPWFPMTEDGTREREPHYSGGLSFDRRNLDRVYVSRMVDGQFEIQLWEYRGTEWSGSPITAGSSTRNVRPIFPYGYTGTGDHLLWMHGDYIHYTRYQTGIHMLLP